MPPTYSPWLNAFERLARFGLSRHSAGFSSRSTGTVDTDCMNGSDWRRHATAETLWGTWGPPQTSPWSAYHRPTLFAALDGIKPADLLPAPPQGLEGNAGVPREAPAWADAKTAILLDLPAKASAAYGALLALRSGHEPVATFNNWPHEKGVVDLWRAIGALLYYVPWVVEARERRKVGSYRHEGTPPPVFLMDAHRLGRLPKPGEFDNRYYLLDSDLPTEAALRKAGIERVAYVRRAPRGDTPPEPWPETDDVNRYLHDLAKRIPVVRVEAYDDAWAWREPAPLSTAIRKTPFNTTKDPAFEGFRRSSAGGFGRLVPEPSSGGGG